MSVAVVTGASSGLGRVIAKALLGAGWQVALAGRRSELLKETAQGAPDGAALVVPADVTSPPSVAALFDAVKDRWGRLDLLVNNAGLFGPAAQADEIRAAGGSSTTARSRRTRRGRTASPTPPPSTRSPA
jgi:NAD(P)-dependent dehydrogenase (short-subunit alcohol dehydrogenase family)